ncbi:hypothetical protein ACWDV4_28135 [Micromonospora sp. NPDC003197]
MDVESVPADEQKRLERLLRKHRKQLLALPHVHQVDMGYELKDGQPTGRLALRVHVDRKQPLRRLPVADRVPEELDGVPVDVIQFNPVPQLARNVLHNPVGGGVQIMNVNSAGAGTLGMIVLHRDSLRPLALSNHHVMVRTPAVAGDLVSQPGTNDPPSILGTVLASDQALDCAVCHIGNRGWGLDVYGLDVVTGWTEARLGMKVVKSGLGSGVTWGIIDGMNSGGFTVVPDTSRPASGQMSLPGDSGSIWLELTTNRAVGLHFAGNGPSDSFERAAVKHMGGVIRTLNILVFDGAAIGQAFIGSHCRVLARTQSGATCDLKVTYPSGRRSRASGLGTKRADGNGWVEWSWRIGTHTRRVGAGTGAPLGRPLLAELTLGGGQTRFLERHLEGTSHTE